jgi:uncharacterized protein (UPF0261 family)
VVERVPANINDPEFAERVLVHFAEVAGDTELATRLAEVTP